MLAAILTVTTTSLALPVTREPPGKVRELLHVNASRRGCGGAPGFPVAELTIREVTYVDPVLQRETSRPYQVYLPTGYNGSHAFPVLLSFHGYAGDWLTFRHEFHLHGNPDNYITIYMSGMGDSPAGNPSWNCGNAGTLTSCAPETHGTCYDSCAALDDCSRCNLYTCYDDVEYTKQVLADVLGAACVDESRLYAVGVSNGAQFAYRLSVELPVFAGIMPMCGTPFEGVDDITDAVIGHGLLHWHGNRDVIIPADGGLSVMGWIYVSVKTVTGKWADRNGCSTDTQHYPTPWDGQHGLACHQYICPSTVANPIVYCMLNGEHGVFPSWGYDFVWWTVQRFTFPIAVGLPTSN